MEKKVRITSGIFWTLMGKNPIMEKSDPSAACLSWTVFFSIVLSGTRKENKRQGIEDVVCSDTCPQSKSLAQKTRRLPQNHMHLEQDGVAHVDLAVRGILPWCGPTGGRGPQRVPWVPPPPALVGHSSGPGCFRTYKRAPTWMLSHGCSYPSDYERWNMSVF